MPIANYPFVDISGTGMPKPGLPVILTNPANGFSFGTWALIDTGADNTVIPEFIAKKLYHDIMHKSVQTDLCTGVSGVVKSYYHTFRLKVLGLSRNGKVLSKVAIKRNKRLYPVIHGLHQMVIGESDFLKRYVLTINYPKKTFSLKLP